MDVVSILMSAVIIVIVFSMSCCDGGKYYRVDLIRKESAQSPLMKSLNQTKTERMQLSMERSKRWVGRLQVMARGGGASSSYYNPLIAGDGGFIMQLGVGNPSPLLQHVIPDTGSDLIWLQCGPKCTICREIHNAVGCREISTVAAPHHGHGQRSHLGPMRTQVHNLL